MHTASTCTVTAPAHGTSLTPGVTHINPAGVAHGLRHPTGPDNGHLPELVVAADGTARAEFFATRVLVAGGDQPALLDTDGSAVIFTSTRTTT